MAVNCVSMSKCSGFNSMRLLVSIFILLLGVNLVVIQNSSAQPTTNLEGYGIKIFRVESGLYPFVHVYARTFNQDMQPLINLNELNIGVMVKGRAYDIRKVQYVVQSIRNRDESIRTVVVMDTSKTMQGKPFENAQKAFSRFMDNKRPQDQVGIIAVTEKSDNGFKIISNFERDKTTLGNRLADMEADSMTTSLYDGIGAAMQMCVSAPEGGIVSDQADYTASCSIVVFSDGKDEGSALTRSDLMNRITRLNVPIPIYSLAYSRVNKKHLKNLQALSHNSFGKYFGVNESIDQMTRSVENINNIIQNDYVVTFRSYLPVDGEEHSFKIGIEYPSKSGRYRYQGGKFEAIETIRTPKKINDILKTLSDRLRLLPDNNPYYDQLSPAPVRTEKKAES